MLFGKLENNLEKSFLKKLSKDENGNALVLIVIFMSVFFLLAAVVVDAGLVYLIKARITNAADAAVLAGAQELPGNPSGALAVAQAYATSNGVSSSQVVFTIIDNNRGIEAVVTKNVQMIFGKIADVSQSTVTTRAIARVGGITAIAGVVPLGVEDGGFQFGQTYTLKVGAGSSETGWFGALALGGPGANTYEDNLTYGYRASIKIGDIIDVKTGNMSNPTVRAIDYRMTQCTHVPKCTATSFNLDCKRLVFIPVIEKLTSGDVIVKGFSVFLLNSVEGEGSSCNVTGTFVRTVAQGDIDMNVSGYGLVGVKLTN